MKSYTKVWWRKRHVSKFISRVLPLRCSRATAAEWCTKKHKTRAEMFFFFDNPFNRSRCHICPRRRYSVSPILISITCSCYLFNFKASSWARQEEVSKRTFRQHWLVVNISVSPFSFCVMFIQSPLIMFFVCPYFFFFRKRDG